MNTPSSIGASLARGTWLVLWLASVLVPALGGAAPVTDVERREAASETTRGAPRVQVARKVVDLGVVPVGPEVVARFTVGNSGDAPLRVYGVETSCSCTVAEYEEEIAPGSTGQVLVKLLTAELEGQVTKGVVLTTNDPAERQVVLTLKALVVGGLKLLPHPVIFMRERAGEGVVGRGLLRPAPGREDDVALTDFSASADWLVVEASRIDAPAPRGGGLPASQPGDWLIEARFRDGEVAYGRRRATVRFRTGLGSQSWMTVSVESNLSPPVKVSAQRLVLGRAPDGARGTLFASVDEGVDPSSLEIRGEPDGLDVRVERATARMFRVDVTWKGDTLEDGRIRFALRGALVSVPVVLPAP